MIFGVLPQKKNQYALRILGNCGEFTSEELLRLSELTAKFGNGKITATSRGTFELNGVSESELEPAIEAVQAAKLRLGGTGATVRAVVACKGTDCRKGMFDVHAFACRLDKDFYGIDVHKKFNIGVFGCLNSLGKAMAQDIGVMPSFTEPGKFEIYIGGLLGNRPVQGKHIPVPLKEEMVADAIRYVLDIYKTNGIYPQRLRTVKDDKKENRQEINYYFKSLEK